MERRSTFHRCRTHLNQPGIQTGTRTIEAETGQYMPAEGLEETAGGSSRDLGLIEGNSGTGMSRMGSFGIEVRGFARIMADYQSVLCGTVLN